MDLSDEEFLKFSDCIFVYKQDIPTAIIMNGFRLFDTSKYRFVDFDGNLKDTAVINALRGLEEETNFLKVLGTYK